MKTKRIRNIIFTAAIVFLLLFFVLAILNEIKFNSIQNLIIDHGMPFVLLSITGVLFLIFMLSNCFLSKQAITQQNIDLLKLRKKIACITATDNIVIMQYNVKSQEFIRWDEVNGKEYRHFTLDDYWKYIHVNDLPIAERLIKHMNEQQNSSYRCEYRYLFPGTKEYSWQVNEIFPFEQDKDGKTISYLGVCHRNNKWHDMQDKYKNFYKQITYITITSGIGFALYNPKTKTFHGADEKGEISEHTITMETFIKKIHPEDRPQFSSIAEKFQNGRTERIHLEYRSNIFNNSQDYNWYVAEFAALHDKDNQIENYICLFRRNDEWHALHENLDRFRKRVSFTSISNGLGFVQYDVATDTFNQLDNKGELSDHNISMEHWIETIYPEDLPIGKKMLKLLREHKIEQFNTEYRYFFLNKYNWFYVNITAYDYDENHQIKSYMCLTRINNVWHEMHDELKSYKNKVSLITSLSGIVFADFNTKTKILHCLNDVGNFKDYEINLDEYLSFLHPEDRSKGEQVVKMMLEHTKEHFHTEYRFTHPWEKDYIWYSVDIAASDYDSEHNIIGYTWLNRNNNAWHKAIDEMLELRGKAELAKMQTYFLTNINHEVRTPLNAIVGFSNIMCDEDSHEERVKYKDIIEKNNQKLLRIVDDVLMLSKIESNDLIFKLTDIDLADFFTKLTNEIRPTISPKVQLICDIKPMSSTLDVSYLKSITSALLNNAIKFTNEGSITIFYEDKDEGLYVSVSDTGIGIDKDEQGRIFERFEKVDSFKEGTGIGLPICKAIITKANGKMGVESELGKGSTFWFWVPRQTS